MLIQGPGGCLVPWRVFQTDPSKSFEDLLNTIVSGGVRVIAPSGQPTEATLERMFASPCKESLSVVDRSLFVGHMSRVFRQFVRYDVVRLKKKKSISFSQSVHHINNVSTSMQCEEC